MKQREILIQKLLEANVFWSYKNVGPEQINDEVLISKTLQYLDVEEINMLFEIYSYDKIKNVWKRDLVPQGDYLYLINRFFAWFYFGAKNPDQYLKNLLTRHYHKLASCS